MSTRTGGRHARIIVVDDDVVDDDDVDDDNVDDDVHAALEVRRCGAFAALSFELDAAQRGGAVAREVVDDPENMLGGASQIVSMIRVKCNDKYKSTHLWHAKWSAARALMSGVTSFVTVSPRSTKLRTTSDSATALPPASTMCA